MNRFFLQIIIVFFTISLVQAQDKLPENRVDYHLSWNGESTLLEVDLVYHSDDKQNTVFTYGQPNAGGQPQIFKILGNIKVQKTDSLVIKPEERKVIVYHKRQGIKHLYFTIDGKLIVDAKRARPNEAFMPTIGKSFFYSMGYQLFMKIDDYKYNQIGVVWDNWPKEMRYFVSSNPEATPDMMQVIPSEHTCTNTFMLQMSNDLIVSKYVIKGIPNYLLTSKSDTTSKLPEKIIPLVKDFIPQVREFWHDYEAPFYVLSAIPLQNKIESTGTGMGFPNGFSFRYSGPLDVIKTHLIAHEVSHNWIGIQLKYQSQGMENNWFNEGFNDYIAVYNLVKTGFFDQKAFLNYMNDENLKPHYSSPIRTISGDSIEANFFKNSLYEKIPYQRGLIYAFYLDNQIRLASKGKKNIRDFLLALYIQNKKDKKKQITIDDFTKAIEPFLPSGRVAEEIKNNMLKGDLIDFNKVKLIDAFRITYSNDIPVLSLKENVDLKKIYN
ncbi:hypothetical protein AR687_13440 [Flavobacteriaceae bacterium CRH]|nr:hypothetical protein AR687_13440 [Flavobacteriaceae bacterium CRH]